MNGICTLDAEINTCPYYIDGVCVGGPASCGFYVEGVEAQAPEREPKWFEKYFNN